MDTAVLAPPQLITAHELLDMPDVGRYELVRGEIITMTPPTVEHGYLVSEIAWSLGNFVAKHKLGWVFVGEVGIFTERSPDTVRGADVSFISRQRAPQRPRKGFLQIAPELVVEVVSPHDLWTDLNEKIEEYFALGVDWVWVVEPKRKAVRVYHGATAVTIRTDTLHGEGILAGFVLSIPELFAE
ncbi:MAG: Uma2 family endonuclease [Anaerolineae bacterium]|nr:Uma2 family endonuclease [Anaerolineae bacterium]